jgi:hypothetical protein
MSLRLITGGVALLALSLLIALFFGAAMMPSYLAGWLFWASLPLGALPVVMLLDMAGPGAGFGLEAALRRLILLTPVAAILLLPVLIAPAGVFPWASGHGFSTEFGRAWMTHGWFVARSIVFLAVWIVLMVLFLRPPRAAEVARRRGQAVIGLLIWLPTATLASVDWAMTVEPDWVSPVFGLLFIAGQMAIAVSAALLLAGPVWRRAAPEAAAAFLLVIASVWMFTHFIQFLVIWSADLPSDNGFYVERSNVFSLIVAAAAFACGFLAPLFVLLSPRNRRRDALLPAMAVAVLFAQALGMCWLVTPPLRHAFSLSLADLLEMAGLGGVMLGLCLSPGPVPYEPAGAPHHV